MSVIKPVMDKKCLILRDMEPLNFEQARPFHYLLVCQNNCWIIGKQLRPWSDAALCCILSGFTLVAQTCLNAWVKLLVLLI